jgi:hypothetical protein
VNVILDCIFALTYSLIGALDIWFAINRFKEQKYFTFGFWIMCAITQVAYLFAVVFEGM